MGWNAKDCMVGAVVIPSYTALNSIYFTQQYGKIYCVHAQMFTPRTIFAFKHLWQWNTCVPITSYCFPIFNVMWEKEDNHLFADISKWAYFDRIGICWRSMSHTQTVHCFRFCIACTFLVYSFHTKLLLALVKLWCIQQQTCLTFRWPCPILLIDVIPISKGARIVL